MSKAEEVLSTLQNDDVWYFAKQDTSFDNAYKAVRIFDQAPDGENPSSYYQRVASENLVCSSTHGITDKVYAV